MYTNSQMKDKVLGEYKRGGSEKQKGAIQYNKRVIAHENFFNLNYAEAVLKLKQKDQGDCIIRPSSKGTDHLTASWKMHTDIINHVDILERDKPNAYSLGKSLFIDEEVFEDLDEIIANYIEPMASNARDLLNHKNFVETGGCRDSMEALIKKAKKENAQRIPYYVTACGKAAKNPAIEGKFMLSFWPSTKQKIRHEFITATPNGFRYRQIVHNTTANLFKYFKNHYTETPPPAPSQKVRQQNQLASLIKNLNVEQVQKLKKMNEPNPHYTPSDLDNVAHTPSELPFQSRPRVSMSRVGDDKDDFKRPSGFGGRDRDNDSRGGWSGDRRGGGRGGRGGRGDRGGFSENRRQPDRSPDPNRSDKGWGGSSGGGGGWGSNDRDKGRSPPRSRGRNNVWGDDNDDKRGGDRRPRGGGRGRGGRDDFRGGRGRGGRGGRGGGRDGGSWGGNRDRGGRGGGSTPSLSRVHDSPPRGGGSWGNRSPPRMERRQSPPSYSKSPARGGGGGGWSNASPPSGGASGGGWGGSTPRKSPPSGSGWGGGSSSGKATPRKSSPDRSKPSSGGGWGSPAKSPGPASWGSPAKQPEKEKSKGWGSPNAATAGSQSPGGW